MTSGSGSRRRPFPGGVPLADWWKQKQDDDDYCNHHQHHCKTFIITVVNTVVISPPSPISHCDYHNHHRSARHIRAHSNQTARVYKTLPRTFSTLANWKHSFRETRSELPQDLLGCVCTAHLAYGQSQRFSHTDPMEIWRCAALAIKSRLRSRPSIMGRIEAKGVNTFSHRCRRVSGRTISIIHWRADLCGLVRCILKAFGSTRRVEAVYVTAINWGPSVALALGAHNRLRVKLESLNTRWVSKTLLIIQVTHSLVTYGIY